MALPETDILKLKRHQIYPAGERLSPSFFSQRDPVIDKATTLIGSMGSCFAANIKRELILAGYRYVQTSEEPAARASSAAWGTVFNTFCMKQEVDRALGRFRGAEAPWPERQRFVSPYRKVVAWGSLEEAESERRQHAIDARCAFEQMDVLILTLGLTEVWYLKDDASVFYQVPPAHVYDPERHAFVNTGVSHNLDALIAVRAGLKELNPELRIIVTVSPVPLRATFRGVNAVVANAESKATLLVAAHKFARSYDDVTYFPSYEIVTTASPRPYQDDNRHVTKATIAQVMNVFFRTLA